MKKFLTMAICAMSLIFAGADVFGAGASRYLSEPSKYINKRVQVGVCGGERQATSPTEKGYVLYLLITTDGEIYALVPETKSKSFSNGLPKRVRDSDGNLAATSVKTYSGTLVETTKGTDKVYAIKIK